MVHEAELEQACLFVPLLAISPRVPGRHGNSSWSRGMLQTAIEPLLKKSARATANSHGIIHSALSEVPCNFFIILRSSALES